MNGYNTNAQSNAIKLRIAVSIYDDYRRNYIENVTCCIRSQITQQFFIVLHFYFYVSLRDGFIRRKPDGFLAFSVIVRNFRYGPVTSLIIGFTKTVRVFTWVFFRDDICQRAAC